MRRLRPVDPLVAPLTIGRRVRCPICGVKTVVLVEASDLESTEATEAIGSGKILPPTRSGIGPTPMPMPSLSQKAAAANYPIVRGYTILGEIGRGPPGSSTGPATTP